MSVTCPKCDYTRKPQDQAPEYECPRCGVIYAKAKPRTVRASPMASESAAEPFSRTQPSQLDEAESEPRHTKNPTIEAWTAKGQRWIGVRTNQVLLSAVLASFVLGYFTGREHIKYEMRSAFADAAAGLKRAFGGDSKPAEPPKKQIKAPRVSPLTPKLLSKRWQEGEYGRSSITFSVEFTNHTGKDIRAFDGNLVFTDLLGNQIQGAKLAVNDRVAANSTLTWDGKLDYNQFISSHERLRYAEIENMKVVYTVQRVMFEDGEVKEYPQ